MAVVDACQRSHFQHPGTARGCVAFYWRSRERLLVVEEETGEEVLAEWSVPDKHAACRMLRDRLGVEPDEINWQEGYG